LIQPLNVDIRSTRKIQTVKAPSWMPVTAMNGADRFSSLHVQRGEQGYPCGMISRQGSDDATTQGGSVSGSPSHPDRDFQNPIGEMETTQNLTGCFNSGTVSNFDFSHVLEIAHCTRFSVLR
jgi:hypothetical protein